MIIRMLILMNTTSFVVDHTCNGSSKSGSGDIANNNRSADNKYGY